jgi:hypothetical protein
VTRLSVCCINLRGTVQASGLPDESMKGLPRLVYFFERRGSFIRCEVHDIGGYFELVIIRPDGSECVERYADADSVHARQVALEKGLVSGGSTRPHGRSIRRIHPPEWLGRERDPFDI